MIDVFTERVIVADVLIGARDWIPVAVISVALIALLTLWGYRQSLMSPGLKFLGVTLKLSGVLLLAVCLIEPLFSGVRPRPGANLFVVLTDNSQSMTVQSGSKIRGDTLLKLLRELSPWRTRLQQDFDVRGLAYLVN